MSEKLNAGGLLNYLRESFSNWGPKKPVEVLAVTAATPMVVPTETPTPADFTVPPESTPIMMPAPTATETPASTLVAEVPVSLEPELPDWLQAGKEEAEIEAPLPEASASAPALVPEAPSALPAAEAEKNPEQLAIEEFEEELLSADDTLTKLRAGESLDETQLRAAKAAAAKANGSVRNLPERYLKVLLASRRLGENRDYTRMDFQKDMLAAIRVFSQTKKG